MSAAPPVNSQTSQTGDKDKQKLEQIGSLLHQSYEYTQQEKYDDGLAPAEKALAIARDLSVTNYDALSSCFYQIAVVYHGKREFARAENFYTQSLQLAERVNDEGMSAAAAHGLANLYFDQKIYDRAKAAYEKALLCWQKFDPDHPGAIAALNRLAQISLRNDKLEEAEVFIKRAMASTEKAHGADYVDVARFLATLVEILVRKGEYDHAEKEVQRFARILQASRDLDARSHLAGALSYFSKLYSDRGQYDHAVLTAQKALEIAQVDGRKPYPDVASFMLNLANIYEDKGDYANAELWHEHMLTLVEKTLGSKHPDLAPMLSRLAGVYDKQGHYGKSEAFWKRAIALLENSPGSEQNLAYNLGQLGWLYVNHGDYQKAEAPFLRAVQIAGKSLGTENPIYTTHLNSLAFFYYRTKNYSQAETTYLSSAAIIEKALGHEDLQLVVSTTGLADIYAARGELERAESSYQKALAIREKSLGDHPDVALSLDSLSWFYVTQGEYGKAEPLFKRALVNREKRFGSDNIQVVPSLNNLANVYRSIGDYQKARPLYERALIVNERTLGSQHRYVSFSLNSLGSLLLDSGEYDRAETLLKRSLLIAEEVSGKDHPDVSFTLTLLALVFRARGDFDDAESFNKRALSIDEEYYGPEDTSVATDCQNLALIYTAQGKFAKAEPLFQRALSIEEKAKGSSHPDIAETLLSVAYFYGAKGDIPQAISTLKRGTDISEKTIANILSGSTGTDEQKRAYMAMDSIAFETKGAVALHMEFAPNNVEAARLALTTILRRKGRVLDAVSDSIQVLRRHMNSDDVDLLRQLANARSRVASMTIDGPGDTPREQYEADLKNAQSTAESLESRITSRSAEFRAAIKPVTIDQIQNAIPKGAALIEIVSYQPFNPRYKTVKEMWNSPRYAAYSLRQDGTLKWVDLGDAKQIDAEVGRFRAALRDAKRPDVWDIAQSVYKKLMRPIIDVIGDAHLILVSSDGELNLIPFGALADENGKYLVERFSFAYLTSGRDLLRMQVTTETRQDPIVIGDPQYDAVLKDSSGKRNGENRGFGLSPGVSSVIFPPLPGTGEEARAVSSVLTGANLLTGIKATKTAVKQVTGPSILHIATHGFFLADERQQVGLSRLSRQLVQETAQSRQVVKASNPLLRSGLAFAGANNRQQLSDDNGILTALEAAGLDLWGTRLVVLSACETGVGEVKVGDGVYGLRRALVIAGVQTQVMSLWPVSDAATRDLMVEYYRGLKNGRGRGDALRNVQLEMMRSGTRSHPFFWASFIQIGDWTSFR